MSAEKELLEALNKAEAAERARLLEKADIRTVVTLSKPGGHLDAVTIAAQAELAARQQQQTMVNLRIARLGLIFTILALGIVTIKMLPDNFNQPAQNYICSKGQGKNLINIIMVQEGFLSKTCRYVQKKGETFEGDCGAELEWHVRNGYRCRKTGLDLN